MCFRREQRQPLLFYWLEVTGSPASCTYYKYQVLRNVMHTCCRISRAMRCDSVTSDHKTEKVAFVPLPNFWKCVFLHRLHTIFSCRRDPFKGFDDWGHTFSVRGHQSPQVSWSLLCHWIFLRRTFLVTNHSDAKYCTLTSDPNRKKVSSTLWYKCIPSILELSTISVRMNVCIIIRNRVISVICTLILASCLLLTPPLFRGSCDSSQGVKQVRTAHVRTSLPLLRLSVRHKIHLMPDVPMTIDFCSIS